MKITVARGRFEIDASDEAIEKSLIKGGFQLDKRRWVCYTKSPEIILRLPSNYERDAEIQSILRRHEMAVAFSHSSEGIGLDFPRPAGLDYLPFQQVGVAYTIQRRCTLIADEPGLGKTIQAAGVLNARPDLRKALVICPSMIKVNWERELAKWLVRDYTIDIADSNYLPETDITIINYDILYKMRPLIDQRGGYDIVIPDECQMVKDETTLRAQGVFGKTEKRKVVMPPIQALMWLFLSGTPMVNRPVDLWNLIHLCDPDDLGRVFEYFGLRYCKGWYAPWGRGALDTSGASNLEELQNRLRGTFMIRRKKKNVLKDLPPKKRQIIAIQPDLELEPLLRREREMFEQNIIKINDAIDRAEKEQAEGDERSYKDTAKGLINSGLGKEAIFSEISKIRHDTAVAKIPFVLTYIKLMLEEHKKIVVFAHHLDLLNAIYRSLGNYGAVMITGDVGEDQRQRAIDSFQEDPNCRVCICAITISVGITLTAARLGILAELDWRPSIVTQAEDRLHRIGQLYEVLIQHLVFENSSDALLVRTIINKQEDIDQAVG